MTKRSLLALVLTGAFALASLLAAETAASLALSVETLKPNLVRVRETGTSGSGMNHCGVLRVVRHTPTGIGTSEETSVVCKDGGLLK